MHNSVLRLENVSRTLYEGPEQVRLVHDVNLDIKAAEFIGITGPSGGGKSSLLYIMGLLDKPSTGDVYIEDISTSQLSDEEIVDMRLHKIGFVFQFHFLLPEFNCFENVMLPMRKMAKLTMPQMKERALYLLDYFGVLHCKDRLPLQMSGGERQRVAVARALANQPALILADEPTGNLDSKNSEIVFDYFQKIIKEEGTTIITITHEKDLANRTDRVFHVLDGRVSEEK